MMKRIFLATSFAAMISLLACSETPPLEPEPEPDACALPGACEVRGVDLVVEYFALAFPAAHPIDAQTGLPWVQTYDSVPVHYRIRNRGDTASPAAQGWLMSCASCPGVRGRELAIPALEPGAVDSGVAYAFPTNGFFVTSAPVLDLELGGRLPDEPFYRNNRMTTSDAYLTVAPDVRGTLQVLSPEVRIDAPLRMILTLRNEARHAIQRDTTISFCFRRTYEYGLDSCHRAFAAQNVPTLGPGATWTDTIDVTLVQQNYLYERHRALPVRLDACFGGRVSYVTQPCAAGANVMLRPHVESACAIPAIVPGTPVNAQFGGLDNNACYIYLAQFEVHAFEAVAGSTYDVQLSVPGETIVGIWDRDGNLVGTSGDRAASGTAAQSGRHYIVLHRYSFDEAVYQLRLTVR